MKNIKKGKEKRIKFINNHKAVQLETKLTYEEVKQVKEKNTTMKLLITKRTGELWKAIEQPVDWTALFK